MEKSERGHVILGDNRGNLLGNLSMDNFVIRTKSNGKGNNSSILRATSRSTNFKPKIIPKAKININRKNKHKPKMGANVNTIIKYFTKDPSEKCVSEFGPTGASYPTNKGLGGGN